MATERPESSGLSKKQRAEAAFASLREDAARPTNHRGAPLRPDPIKTCVHCQNEHPDVDQSLKIYTCPTCTKYLPSVLKRGQQ